MITIEFVHLDAAPDMGKMVVLKETPESDRFFLMFVGDAEFTAIAKEKGLVESKRPITHDLYLSIMEKLQVEFLRCEIHEVRDDTYYAKVIFRTNDTEYTLDSRPSDAVVLALNRKIPILVAEDLFRRNLTQKEMMEYEELIKKVKF